MHNITSIDGLISLEPSLATRIISYYMQFKIFCLNINFGVGFDNVCIYLNKIFWEINNFYTIEIMQDYYRTSELTYINVSLIWTLLASTGLFGFLLYVAFFMQNINMVKNFQSYCNKKEFSFIKAIKLSLVLSFFISFYNLSYNSNTLWFLYGMVLLYSYTIRQRRREINEHNSYKHVLCTDRRS